MSNELDNIVDALTDMGTQNFEGANEIASALRDGLLGMTDAITPRGTVPGSDGNGGCVSSLTEACMGITGSLCRVADAIERLAESVDNRGQQTSEEKL